MASSSSSPPASATVADRLLVIGANHRSSSLALRDALFVDDAATPEFLDQVADQGLDQVLVISTCDRVEVMAMTGDKDGATESLTKVLAERARVDAGALADQLYAVTGAEALRHCFAVAASLDSLVVGEPHVLGQMKDAHRLAQASGLTGSDLEGVLQAAYQAAKRVRSETGVAEGPVSVAAAAIQFARDLHGDLDRCSALLIGSGEMGELVAESLKEAGVTRLSVTAPRAYRAETAAKTLEVEALSFDTLDQAMADADIIVTAVSGRSPLVSAEALSKALKARKQRPIFVIDTGIPGDVEASADALDNAFLYDLNDLEQVALEGRSVRESAAREAWEIVDQEVAKYLQGHRERAAAPAITALRERFEAERQRALAEGGGDPDRVSRLLVSRLLHDPSEAMRAIASKSGETAGGDEKDWREAERLIRYLFKLEGHDK